ncbi:uncharacterized protein [Eurosta solidaginis]|uniref:uncharacterized protein n=1 Tax=Eurosta solidaginis TaxID=178769 RepID=UPI003530EC9D
MDKKPKKKQTLPYRGKPLFYVLRRLPNHGVGRLIIRGSVRQEETRPTYMRIIHVDIKPVGGLKNRKKKYRDIPTINVIVEKTHLGLTIPKEHNIKNVTHLSDFLLVPIEEEEKYLKNSVVIQIPKGHYHLTSGQRHAITKLVEGGMPLIDARRLVLEKDKNGPSENSIAGGDAEAVEAPEFDEEFQDYGNNEDVNLLGSNSNSDNKRNLENGARPKERSEQQHRSSDMTNKQSSEQNVGFSLEEDPIGDFTEDELQRIHNMIINGINLDTARQMEWERKMAFENRNNLKQNRSNKNRK